MTPNSHLQQHEMSLEKTHPSGAEEWFCPICGRRFLMHFQAEAQKLDILVLEHGDQFANHFGSKGELQIVRAEVAVVDDEPVLSEELRAAIDQVLDDIDFNDWLDEPGQ